MCHTLKNNHRSQGLPEMLCNRDPVYFIILFHILGHVFIFCGKNHCRYHIPISELPKPNLGDLSEIKLLKTKLKRTKNPNVLGYTYTELLELDKVEVELEPDKKGLILKHREYTVSSRVSVLLLLLLQDCLMK